jgi:hypothetical protein
LGNFLKVKAGEDKVSERMILTWIRKRQEEMGYGENRSSTSNAGLRY